MAEKISSCVDFRNKGKNYLQVFKTMQGVHRWIGLFDIVFAAFIAVGFLFRQVLCFYITFHLFNDRGLKIFPVSATECSKCTAVLLFRHNLIFVYP